MVEIVTLFSREIDAALIDSHTNHIFPLLFLRFPERSLKFDHRHGRVIYGTCRRLVYLSGGSIEKTKNLLAIVGCIPLLKNPKRHHKFTERIVNIPGIAFVLRSRKVRSSREIPMTRFFRPEHFVFEIQRTVGFHATIVRVESRLDNDGRFGDRQKSRSRGRNGRYGRSVSSASPGRNRHRYTRGMKGKYAFGKYARIRFFEDFKSDNIIRSSGKDNRGRITFQFLSRRCSDSEIEFAIEIRGRKCSGERRREIEIHLAIRMGRVASIVRESCILVSHVTPLLKSENDIG